MIELFIFFWLLMGLCVGGWIFLMAQRIGLHTHKVMPLLFLLTVLFWPVFIVYFAFK